MNTMVKQIVCKVWERSINGQKLITIPKDSNIEGGDFVIVKKVELENKEEE